MAKGDRKQVPGMVSGASKGKSAGRGRVSVAAVRKSSGDRTQLIIGGVAIAVIVAVIVVGIMMYSKNSATQADGYGTSTLSVATVDDAGVVTVSNGSPELSLDVYEDALCPICADFEAQYGQQMAKAVDDGQLELKFRMVDFLNAASFSKDYSTRAYAALMTVAEEDGANPGVFMSFHTAIFDSKNQPRENGSKDLTNEELADIAADAGASEETQQLIADGTHVAAAAANAQSNLETLREAAAKVGRSAGTPTVAKDGIPLATNDVDWLTNQLTAVYGEAADSETTEGDN